MTFQTFLLVKEQIVK